ncbi:MAG: hypothetical protein GY757_58145 [bacterium]|nr:hypothetical protein [bacterium]
MMEEAKGIAGYFDIVPPQEGLYKGEEFFAPFASMLLKILEVINKSG